MSNIPEKFNLIFKRIINAGAIDNTVDAAKQRIVQTNQSALIMMFFGVMLWLIFAVTRRTIDFLPIGGVLLLFYVIPIFLNNSGLHKTAKLWLTIGTPILIGGADVYTKYAYGELLSIMDYYTPYLFLTASVLFPFILFTFEEISSIIVSCLINILVILLVQPLHEFLGYLPQNELLGDEAFFDYMFAILAAFFTFTILAYFASRSIHYQQLQIKKLLINKSQLSRDIKMHETALQEAYDSLKQARTNYQSIFDISNQAIVIHGFNDKGVTCFIDANNEAQRLLQYTKEELLKLSPSEIDTRTEQEMHELITSKEHSRFDAVLRTKTGRLFDAEINFSFLNPNKTLGVAMIRDISIRKLQDNVALLMTNKTTNLFGLDFLRFVSDELIKILDIDGIGVGQFEDIKSGDMRLLAYGGFDFNADNPVYNLSGTPCLRVVADGDYFVAENVQKIYPEDLFFQRENIEAYWGRAFYDANNNVIGHLFVLKRQKLEMTDWLENILNMCYLRIGAELQQMAHYKLLLVEKQKAVEANNAKSVFLATMSHELRTPLNSILGFTKLLKKDFSSGKQLDFLNKIERSGGNLLLLVSDVLDLSKIEAGKLELRPHVTNLRRELQDIYSFFAFQSMEKKLIYTIRMSDYMPDFVQIDALRFRQILFNIISNAFKFTHEGGVRIHVEAKQQDTSVDLSIRISDTGIGIDPAFHDKIFKPFEQNISTTQNTNMGTGLGLSITRQLINLMNGQISVESEPGKGSTFALCIPNLPLSNRQFDNIVPSEIAAPPHNDANHMAHSIKIKQAEQWNKIVKNITKDRDLENFSLFLGEIKQAVFEAHNSNSVKKINALSNLIIEKSKHYQLTSCVDLGNYLQEKNNTFQFDIVFGVLSYLNNWYK